MSYINDRQFKDEKEHLRILNQFNDNLLSKKVLGYQSKIDDTARDLPGLPGYGAYVISIYGVDNGLPSGIFAVTKSDSTASGSVSMIVSQVGTGSWTGFALTLSTTATAVQIAHNNTGVSGLFNVSILGIL